ncbi:hypothetical protein [Anaerostipes sp.]|uniref:hypothetical protein n=1 Tax=Anaerostipes sp. TaxID=1872530 RepID=UPI0025BABD0A|nr:hypothetical protein [Anaerostipes sp.]MBS7007476.1 hypothetical protein [Anaerostipes sp.]
MSISNMKKKGVMLGAAFLIVGMILIGAGWGMADFQPENLKEQGQPKWYRTVHVREHGAWVGIRLKNGVYLLSFGGTEPD